VPSVHHMESIAGFVTRAAPRYDHPLMDEYDLLLHPEQAEQAAVRRPARLVGAGLALLLLGLSGLLLALLWPAAEPSAQVAGVGSGPAGALSLPTATALSAAPTPTQLPPPTLIQPRLAGEPTSLPVSPTGSPGTPLASTPAPTGQPTPEGPQPTPPEIVWTQEEKNALGWLCYGEVGGMGSAKIDGCLSVISTVRMRYAYPNSFPETDVISTLLRPGQFNVTIYTDRPGPDPDLNWAVEQYQAGARGSCNGFLFFDSVPGGPSLCTIYAANGQWMEFHNGWN